MSETLTDVRVEIRSGDGFEVADVSFPKRIVTVVAMPYDRPAQIFERGRSFVEIVAQGAFTGIEKRAGQIRANRDHSWDKLAGKIVALHPSRKEGLVTEVRMFNTDVGERTLVECDEGGLDASAGFSLLRRDDGRVWDDAEEWDRGRTTRRLNRLWLDHLAFVPNPAYPGAVVESVRNIPASPQEPLHTETPNRDRLTVEEQKAAADALNRRWGS
jgi:phage head maturation protease